MPEFKPENPGLGREEEDFTRKFFDRMGLVIKKYGSLEAAVAAVDKDSDVAEAVVKRWFQTGVGPVNSVLRKKILASLEHLATATGGGVTKKLIPPLATKPEKPSELDPASKPITSSKEPEK